MTCIVYCFTAAVHQLSATCIQVSSCDTTFMGLQRTGDRRELLRGPLLYGTIIGTLTIIFWRESPSGVTAIAVLCAGDGLADIVGRRLGAANRLPYSPDKVCSRSSSSRTGLTAVLLLPLFFQQTRAYSCPAGQSVSQCSIKSFWHNA